MNGQCRLPAAAFAAAVTGLSEGASRFVTLLRHLRKSERVRPDPLAAHGLAIPETTNSNRRLALNSLPISKGKHRTASNSPSPKSRNRIATPRLRRRGKDNSGTSECTAESHQRSPTAASSWDAAARVPAAFDHEEFVFELKNDGFERSRT
jgi:hypothetical protein